MWERGVLATQLARLSLTALSLDGYLVKTDIFHTFWKLPIRTQGVARHLRVCHVSRVHGTAATSALPRVSPTLDPVSFLHPVLLLFQN